MKKSLQKKALESPTYSESVDMDPYSTSIIEELLNTNDQWKQQNQIVKLTFRALTEIIQVHSESIKDLKSIITTRASKTELGTGLALKSNVSDMSRMMEDISSTIDSKVSYADINSILKDYAQKKDLREVLLDSAEKEKDSTVRQKLERKEDTVQIKIMQARIDEFQKEITRRLGGCVTLPQFQELISVVEQKVNVAEMNEVLANRVTKQYLATCLQKKVSKSDFEQLMGRKVDTTDLDYLVSSLQNKVSLSTLQRLTEVIEHKADKSDLVILSNEKVNKMNYDEQAEKVSLLSVHMQKQLNQLKKQIEHSKYILNEGLKLAERENQTVLRNYVHHTDFDNVVNHLKKHNQDQYCMLKKNFENLEKENYNQIKYENFMRELTHEINLRKNCEEKLYEQIDDVRKRAEEISNKTLAKTQFFNFRSEIAELLEEKIQTEYVQEAFNKWEVQLNTKMTQDKEEVFTLINRIQKALADSIAANTADIMKLNSGSKKDVQIDLTLVEETIRKVRRQVDDCRKTVDVAYEEIQSRICIAEYESDLLQIRKKFDNIGRQLGLKANIKDVCVLADSKPNIDDVNKALQELNSALDLRVTQSDLQNILKDQASINQTLCSENIVGRWLWQSGDAKSGGLVPWEVECANTIPDHFYWEKDKTSILVLAGGIYQLTACIFSKTSSLVILVNGEAIGSKSEENSNSGNVVKKAGKKKKEKQFMGTKIEEFVMVPSRSRISVSISSEGGEGFLNIRRL